MGTETIALDDFRFAMAIHTGQYASFDMISFIIVLLNRLKATNYKLLVSRPGETMESMRAGGYYYYYLEYSFCTIQH